MEEELTLRDIAAILQRYRLLLIGLPILCAALAFGLLSLSAQDYQSQQIVSVRVRSVNTENRTASLDTIDPELLPSATALVEAYSSVAPQRLSKPWNLTPREVSSRLTVSFDQDSSAVTLRARATQPDKARQLTESATQDFKKYVEDSTTETIRQTLSSRIEQIQLAIVQNRQALEAVDRVLERTPETLSGRGQASISSGLEAAGVDPRFTGNSSASANPAYTLLAVRSAELEAQLASNEASLQSWRSILEQPKLLLTLAQQSTQVRTLSNANLPLQPIGIGRGLAALLGFVVGGVLALLAAFVHNALQPASVQTSATRLGTPSREL
ncbi:capsular polysaccharide biosynthesis protein [Deinobacterium chartae]|uniref:Capsular polysaccharide biosynthesis protein n=1 Tax=Deinobacterium chartae TaxID=521158 RepID=A0A841I463_9DEIO|nr:hypothetical protein [Deinobacterium chartae]MBB6100113.1 capsular polysaccharide biosynthesis protein [Deinobacterium chartae]